jgi:hypothetical protein
MPHNIDAHDINGDVFMPSQWRDHLRPVERTPLQKLFLALLEVSLVDILGHRVTRPRHAAPRSRADRGAHDRRYSRHRAAALAWMQCDGECRTPFCYREVCSSLGIDADRLRNGVLAKCAARTTVRIPRRSEVCAVSMRTSKRAHAR